jgi:hypothetical protein
LVWTRDGNPDDWATAHMNLGFAYRERHGGDGSENRERAIGAFEKSLSVWTRARNPGEWAAARMNLGVAYERGRHAPPFVLLLAGFIGSFPQRKLWPRRANASVDGRADQRRDRPFALHRGDTADSKLAMNVPCFRPL